MDTTNLNTNYEKVRQICEADSKLSVKVIDEFLLYYAAAKYHLNRSMTEAFNAYRHITQDFKQEWVNLLKAQYIAHKIFKKGGLVRKLTNHVELNRFNQQEKDFLSKQSQVPWRFCFSKIVDNPAPDFFIMEDVLSGEIFTLFSPNTSETLKSQSAILWFNLIAFNGSCWVTYGPIIAYKSFDVDDIFFFATELESQITSEDDIARNIDKNPLPYMMLLSGANFPITMNKQDQLVHNYAEYDIDQIDTESLKKAFTSAYSHGVYQFTLKRWGVPPHFSQFYYDEERETIFLLSMTDRGFKKLVTTINAYGYNFPEESQIRINPSMEITSEKILKKDLRLNPYDKLFQVDTPPEKQDFTDRMNHFLSLILPDFNAGRMNNLEKYAKEAGVDIETARDLVEQLRKKYGRF